MRVLIVEDDEGKARQLEQFMTSTYTGADISTQVSYQSGLSSAVDSPPNLMLLDMNLPNYDPTPFDGGYKTLFFAGRDILRELKRLRITTRAIVVTQFEQFGEGEDITTLDELTTTLENDFPDLFCGTVYYHPSQEDWKRALKRLIDHVLPQEAK